jgi:hypothetical protein
MRNLASEISGQDFMIPPVGVADHDNAVRLTRGRKFFEAA